MVWSWAVTSLRFLGRLDRCEYVVPALKGDHGILFLNPGLESVCLFCGRSFRGCTICGSLLAGFEIKESCHFEIIRDLSLKTLGAGFKLSMWCCQLNEERIVGGRDVKAACTR